MTYWYLATPYSKYEAGIEAAFQEAARIAGQLVAHGVPVYSPICHTHPAAIHGELDPYDHAIWIPADLPLMRAASGLIVAKMQGWEESYGIGVEIEEFRASGKPVHYMDPSDVEGFANLISTFYEAS